MRLFSFEENGIAKIGVLKNAAATDFVDLSLADASLPTDMTALIKMAGGLQAISNKASQGIPSAAQAPLGLQANTPADTNAVLAIAKERCIMCHGAGLQSKNIRVDSIEALDKHAALIYQQVVVTKLMPMNNATGVTPAERQLIADWFKARK